jgi:hypothetical protein
MVNVPKELADQLNPEQLQALVDEYTRYEAMDDKGKVEFLTEKLMESTNLLSNSGQQLLMLRQALMGASHIAKQMLKAILGDDVDRREFTAKHAELVESYKAAADAESKITLH